MADVRKFYAGIIVAIICKRRRRKRKVREVWEKEWLRRRRERGVYRELLEELRLEDAENYRRFLRMDTATFEVRLKLALIGLPLYTFKKHLTGICDAVVDIWLCLEKHIS